MTPLIKLRIMAIKIYKNYFDIVILPPEKIRSYSIGLSKQLYKQGSMLVLGKKNFLPHISLYHIPVKNKNFETFITELEKTAKGSNVRKLKINDLMLWKPHYSVLLMTDRPKWLKELYLKIIKNTSKYFDWDYGVEEIWHTDKLPKIMQKNIKKYGTPMVGKYFIPHITLGVFQNEKDMIRGYNKLKLKKYNFKPKSIYVCELGENHSCQKIIKEIHF